jgi:hypothetical protein
MSTGTRAKALYARKVEIHLRQRDGLLQGADVAGKRLCDDGGLLENLLLHIMAVIALFDRRRRHARGGDFALDRIVVLVENLRAVAGDDDPIAFLQIGNLLRQRRERERVRTEISFAFAIADDQRRTEPRADQEIGKFAEGNRQRKGTAQAGEDSFNRFGGGMPSLNLFGHQMRDHLGIGLTLERPPACGQFIAQLFEILDNAIVHQRDFTRGVRMRIARRRRAMRRPAGMRDADIARRVVGLQDSDEVRKLPLRTPADKLAARHGANSSGVIPPILHPLQAIDQTVRDR